jgi:hypothetical protein
VLFPYNRWCLLTGIYINELKIKINQLLDDKAFKNKIKAFKEITVKNYSPEILKQTLNEIGL